MLKKAVDGKELIVYEKQFITGKETRYPFDPEGHELGFGEKVLENGFQEAGKTFQLKVYSPDLGMKAPVKAKIICSGKTYSSGEEKIQAYEVDMELLSIFGSLNTKSWFDKDCVALRTDMNMGGMNISMIQSTKEARRWMLRFRNYC